MMQLLGTTPFASSAAARVERPVTGRHFGPRR
jgi:hypothetical protein